MFWWLMKKNNFLTVSWLSGLLSAEIFISTGEWGGPDATSDRWKQSSSAVRVSGGYPGNVKDPSCRWNAGLLSTKSTCRSLHSTWRPALRASMRSVTSWDFRLGHTLETVTDRAMVFALSMRSLYSPTDDVGDGLVHTTVAVVTTNCKDNTTEFVVTGELVDWRLYILNVTTADAYTFCGHQLSLVNVSYYTAPEKRHAMGSGKLSPCFLTRGWGHISNPLSQLLIFCEESLIGLVFLLQKANRRFVLFL